MPARGDQVGPTISARCATKLTSGCDREDISANMGALEELQAEYGCEVSAGPPRMDAAART